MANLGPVPKFQFIAASGEPAFEYKVYTYAAGTDTPLATYTNAGAGTPNANPVILDEYGTANIWFSAASYKIVVKTPSDVTVYTVDNVSPNLASGGTGLFADGNAAAPGIAYANQTSTGLYRSTSPVGVNVSVAGTQHTQFNANQMLTKRGTNGFPAYSFLLDNASGMYSPSNNNIAFVTDTTSQLEISTTTITPNLPVRGTNGTGSQPAFGFSGESGLGLYKLSSGNLGLATSGTLKFAVLANGRIYGTALHNTGDITGTSAQYIASATYVPTGTIGSNVSAVLTYGTSYTRVGNVVTIGGIVDINTISATTNSRFNLTVPIASNFTTSYQVSGTATQGTSATETWTIQADYVTDQLQFNGYAAGTGAHTLAFTVVYEIL